MAVALTVLGAAVALAVLGQLEGGPLATVLTGVVTAFCAANLIEHRG